MTQLFSVIQVPLGPSLDPEFSQAIRVTNQNFRALSDYLNRAVSGGALVAAGSITLAMLAADAKTLVGDVTGIINANTVGKIKNIPVTSPVAGDDGEFLRYNHGALTLSWEVPGVALHAPTHKKGGTDPLKLNEFADPTASVEFAQQQALQWRFENRRSDPGSPATGQTWLRTDL